MPRSANVCPRNRVRYTINSGDIEAHGNRHTILRNGRHIRWADEWGVHHHGRSRGYALVVSARQREDCRCKGHCLEAVKPQHIVSGTKLGDRQHSLPAVAAGLVNQGCGGRSTGIVEHGVPQSDGVSYPCPATRFKAIYSQSFN